LNQERGRHSLCTGKTGEADLKQGRHPLEGKMDEEKQIFRVEKADGKLSWEERLESYKKSPYILPT